MNKHIINSHKNQLLSSLFISIFCTVGIQYLFFTYISGTDDILTKREIIISVVIGFITLSISLFMSEKYSARTLLLSFICAIFGSLAINFEYPELMQLPVQLPADNIITVLDIDEGASISMTWAYWFQPRMQQGDPFLSSPDRDISFSQLETDGNWDKINSDNGILLATHESGSSIGIPTKFRTHLGVLCFKSESGKGIINISGEEKTLIISPEITIDQPMRVIMRNGLLPEIIGNALQIFFWSGTLCFFILSGIFICKFLQSCQNLNKNILIYFCSFLLPCLIILSVCFFLKITPFGEKTFLINDMWGEYADYMAYFRSILSGENDLFYSFSKSLGDDLLSLLAFYVINPLNWLVCLFKPEGLPLAVMVLVIIRYGIAGVTAAVYFVKRRNCGFSALLFSVCYALMSFNIVNAENTNLRESAMVLPLVIMGIEQLIEKGSIQTYIWSLAAAIFLNYYSGYQICIFSMIYFLFYYTCKENKLSFKKAFLSFSDSSLLAAGLTAFLLIPVIFQLQDGPKTFDPSIFKFSINTPWDALFGKLLVSSYDVGQIANGFPNLYTGLICIFLTPMFFINREISAKEKWGMAGLMIVSILILQINPLNLVLHGFSSPLWWPYRYSFIVCWFLLLIAQKSFSHRNGWTKSGITLTIILAFVLTVLLSRRGYEWMTPESLKLNLVLLASSALLLTLIYYGKITGTAGILTVMMILEFFLNASHILSINTAYERSNTVQDYSTYYNTNKPVIDRIMKEDNGFYRIEKTYSRTPNDPMLLNYNGITHYSSTLSNNVMTFLQKTGFRRYPPYRILYWEGSDIAMDSLLGIKYLVSDWNIAKPYKPVFTENQYTVYENPYALPVMFTASKDILDIDLSREKAGFELQNKIFSALVGEDIAIYRKADVSGPVYNKLITQTDMKNHCFYTDEENNGALSWKINVDDINTLYAYFPSDDLHQAEITVNDKPFGYYYDNFSYHILHLGSFENGSTLTLKITPMEKTLCLNNAQFYYENLELLNTAVSALHQDKTELYKVTSSHLTGFVESSSDKMLFLSIPYNSGWTVKIDDQKVPVSKIFNTFMVISIPNGTHLIDISYYPVGLFPGTLVSLISIIVVILVRKKVDAQNRTHKAC